MITPNSGPANADKFRAAQLSQDAMRPRRAISCSCNGMMTAIRNNHLIESVFQSSL